MSVTPPVLRVQGLQFSWPGAPAPCIDIAHFEVQAGEALFVHGPSGCGKSTLLSLLAGVLVAGPGQVALRGQDWATLSATARDRHRVANVGYIFQQFNLLPYLSVMDNVLLPGRFSAQRRAADARAQAQQLLSDMGLPAALWKRAALHMSVGQQQRVAAARALIGQPALVIADEPTSALDEERRDSFLDVLMGACAGHGSALVLVSHDPRIAARFVRHVALPELNRAGAPAEVSA